MLLIAGLAALLLPAVLAARESATENDPAGEGHASSFGIDLSWPADLVYPSERTLKADQIEALGYDPQVIFFGGSRSVRFDPAYLEKQTGLPGYNLAMTNGKSEDAFVFANFLHEHAPTSAPLWIWGVQRSLLHSRDLDPGLVQDPRLNRYLPTRLLWTQAMLLSTDPARVTASATAMSSRRYSIKGMLLRNPYDTKRERGVTLAHSLRVYIRRILPKVQSSPKSAVPTGSRARDYFEQTLGLLNSYGVEPIIVSLPVHPQVLTVFRAHHWQQRQDEFVAFFERLRTRYRFRFIDLTEVESFDGDPDAFYDGVHIDAENARRVTDTLIAAFPDLFAQASR